MISVSGVSLDTIRASLKGLIDDERSSAIKESMAEACKLAVCIPVYNETFETILRPLSSLAVQQNVAPEEFEIVLVVNNSALEAEQKITAFLKNQELLKVLKQYLKSSPVNIHLIDKSSPNLADNQNHVAHARNRGCLEIAQRFLSGPLGLDGIVAITDADCRLSPDYVSSIIKAFNQHSQINGLSGAMEHEIDQSLPYYQSIKKAFDSHVGYSGRSSPAAKYPDGVVFKKLHGINYQPLNTGQDMAIKVKTWLLSGGFPDRPSGEDYHFGKIVENLDGDVAAIDHYTVYPLIRSSSRAGLASYGRRVDKIVRAVSDYYEGVSERVMIPNLEKQNSLFRALSDAAAAGTLSKDVVINLMLSHGCNLENINPLAPGGLAETMNQEMAKTEHDRDYAKMENYVMQEFFNNLPQKDVTDKIRF